jgi:LDH2 family malate/lactate/ureidoglycolate dehydrogenase
MRTIMASEDRSGLTAGVSGGSARVGGDVLVAGERLCLFERRLFEALGMPADDARLFAEHLLWADLHGQSFFGARKVPQYVQRIRAGGTTAVADPVVLADLAGFVHLDARDAWGHVVGHRAMLMVVEKARLAGVGVAVIRNTTSCGVLGYYAALAAREGMIGLAINNSPPLQSAWGGTGKTLGNQAFGIASPAGRYPPLILDMATSAMSLAAVHEYAERGEPLPDGVALTAQGAATVDPAAAVGGTLLPMAGHRGSGLAMLWEVLTGLLAGGPRFSTNVTFPDVYHQPQGVSLFLLAIDPAAAMPRETFVSRVDALIEHVHASVPATGVARVRVPGERSQATAAQRHHTGIPIPGELAARLSALGAELGVAWL